MYPNPRGRRSLGCGVGVSRVKPLRSAMTATRLRRVASQPGPFAVAPNRNTVVAQTTPHEARVVVKIIAEHPGNCPAQSLRMYSFVYVEGAGVPDAKGYVIATVRATTDITILNGRVLSVTPSHHDWQWDVPVRLEQFPPVPMDGITTTHSLDVIFSALPPSPTPDVSCMYIDGDGSVKESRGHVETAARSFIATLKGALFGLGGMQRNAEGVYGVEGEYRGPNNSTFKYTAEWFAGRFGAGLLRVSG